MAKNAHINSSGGTTINSKSVFCSVANNISHLSTFNFKSIIKLIDKQVKLTHGTVTQNALNKCHGDWYEWIISFISWEHRIINDKKYILIKLPNASSFDVSSLYTKRLHGLIMDLKSKVLAVGNVELISSNPDFVIIDTTNFQSDEAIKSLINTKINIIDDNSIKIIESIYEKFIGLCSLDDIVGYLSVKTSLRPDRRLQLSHEGSLMKAIYVHLQTRDWIIDPVGIKYYGAATEVSAADIQGLNTVATHSITNVQSKPQAAVDKLFAINNRADAENALKIILSN